MLVVRVIFGDQEKKITKCSTPFVLGNCRGAVSAS